MPPLPGVPEGETEWFWRDVLAAPLPGEALPQANWRLAATPTERLDALAALSDDLGADAATTLMAALRDEQIAVAAAAAHELARHGSVGALPRLIKGFGPFPVDYDVPLEVRAAEAAAAARLGHPAGVELLLLILREKTEFAGDVVELQWTRTDRMAFIQELALPGIVALAGTDFGFHTSAPIPARTESVRAMLDWWESQRLAIWAASGPFEDPALVDRVRLLVGHLGAYQLRQIDGARHTLTHLGPGVLPFLEEGLGSTDDYVRMHCLEVLERLPDLCDDKTRGRIAIMAAGALLEDTPGIAAQAARVCGAARVADPLVVGLRRRTEPEVLVAVVDALGHSGRPAARDELDRWAADRTPADMPADLQAALAGARLALDPAASAEPLLALLADEDPSTAFAALERLIRLTGSDHGVDPAAPVADRTEALRRAAEALAARPARG